MWGSALKLTEAANRHPDFWSGFKDLQNRFSVKTYNSQHEAYAQSIRSSKNLQQADAYASQLQDWHNSLTDGFYLDVNKMLQKFDSQLKSVCEPPVMMPDPEPIHPIGDHHANAQQANPANNDEIARLMQMIEDMRGQLQDQRNTNNDLRTANTDLRADKVEMRERLAQKDTVIAEQNTTITDFRIEVGDLQAQLVEKDVAIAELRTDKENLTQEITNKDVTINGLNLAIEQEHARYDELNERYVALLGDGD
jgi:predicted nuclease with TOPRIM domain